MFLLSIKLCENPDFLYLFLILNIGFKILTVVLPIIIMYRAIAPFAKAVVSGEEFNKFVPGIFKSLCAAFIIFILPSLFTFLFGTLLPNEGVVEKLTICFNNGNIESINLYRKAREIEDEEERKRVTEALNQAAKDRQNQEDAYNESMKGYKEELKRRQEQRNQANNGNSNTGDNPGQSPSSSPNNSTIPAGEITIHVGDSRTVGMCAAITGSYSGCSYDSSGPRVYGNDVFIAQGSMGYNWFASSAVPAVNSIISNNPNNTYNIISYMGVNWLLSDIDKYIPKYNELATGSWSKQNIILVSVNPVNESVEAEHGYSTKNANIITFNTKLKNGINASNMRYCDVYNSIYNNFGTSDGLHYTASTYRDIYNIAKSCI